MIEINSINKKEALKYLGYYDEKPTADVLISLGECENELLTVIKPRYIYKCFNLIRLNEFKIALKDCELELKGNSISKHLYYCEKAVLICATISSEADRLINKTQVDDLAKAVIMDSLASAAIEQLCDGIDDEIKQEFSEYSITSRFSPGYGDLPLSSERDLLAVMDAQRKIGLCITDGDMLSPRKSVTAIVGLSKTKIQKNDPCEDCMIKTTCEKRKRGERCGL
ncbi:MAG: methionine synthase [Oscillospiraceae bacterium]